MKLAFCLFAGLVLSLSVLATGGGTGELVKKTSVNVDLITVGE